MIKLCAINDEVSDSFERSLIALKKNYIDYIEIRKINNKMFDELTPDEQNEVIYLLNKYNVKVAVLDSSIGKKNIDDQILFHKYLELALLLNAKAIRIFSNLSDEYLKYINNISEQRNIELYMENEPNTKFESFYYFYNLKDRLNLSNVFICYDNENYYRTNNKKSVKKLLYVKHIHLRDYKDNYIYILEGDLQIDKLLERLNDEKYDGLISIESHLPMIMKLKKETMFDHCIKNIRKMFDSFTNNL